MDLDPGLQGGYMPRPRNINKLFGVTRGPSNLSLYEVSNRFGLVRVVKLAMDGLSTRGKDQLLVPASGLAIGASLWTFMLDRTSNDRLEDQVAKNWRACTSGIVALFVNTSDAVRCYSAEGHHPYDGRWADFTRDLVARVGPNHPRYKLCANIPMLLALHQPEKASA